jgi:hypothetical protein
MSFEFEVTSDFSPEPGDSERASSHPEAQAINYRSIGVFSQRPKEEAKEEEFGKVRKERHRHCADWIKISG